MVSQRTRGLNYTRTINFCSRRTKPDVETKANEIIVLKRVEDTMVASPEDQKRRERPGN